MTRKRRVFGAAFKVKVALAVFAKAWDHDEDAVCDQL